MSIKERLDAILKQKVNKDYVLNFEETVTYKVSSGSLKLDIEMDGGLSPGIARFSGGTESGKTSCALTFAKNFQESVENGYLVYFKAEGRLTEKMIERHGLNREKMYVVESNVYEVIIDTMRDLVKNNEDKNKYFFIIDSVDGCIRKEDLEKTSDEAVKVAGGALMTSNFLRIMASGLAKRGHICILIHQNRTKISVNKYDKRDPNALTQSSGGNASVHYSDWIFEFLDKNMESAKIRDTTKKEPSASEDDVKGEVVGHFCKIAFRKTPNERTHKTVSYPVRYRTSGGKTVWREYEIYQLLLQFGLIKKAGAWFKFEPPMVNELKKAGIKDFEQNFQGETRALAYLETRSDIIEHFCKFFKETYINTD